MILFNKTDMEAAKQAYYAGRYHDAAFLFSKINKRWDAESHYCLGMMFFEGKGGCSSYEEAFKMLKFSVKKGMDKGISKVGQMYLYGTGTAPSYKKAYKLLKRAANNGDVEGPYHLGIMYESGIFVHSSSEEAIRYYRQAAEKGYEPAF